VEGLCTPEEYRRSLQEALLLLEGKTGQLVEKLTARMKELAEAENFEAAALCRNRIKVLRDLGDTQKITSAALFEADIFAYFHDGNRASLQVFTMRGGQILGKKEFFWEELEFFDPGSFLRDALQQYYLNSTYVPRRIMLPVEVEDQEVVTEWLREKRKKSGKSGIKIIVPQRGKNLDLLTMVERNARLVFESRFRVLPDSRRKDTVLEQLRQDLGLQDLPRIIEAFDISTIQGSETVASMVSCLNGVMQKKEYKKFIIKDKRIEGPDDFAAMQETVYRRYKRLSSAGEKLPDLILVDGGKGQVHAAYQALSRLELDELPLAGIAKKEEIIFVQGQDEPIFLDRHSPALHLIQEIRDEAHRFAVTFHRKRRSKRDFTSELDNIQGIGPKRKKRLLQNFGSITRIRRASVEELAPFLGKKLAVEVKNTL
jgi:excinuclease ABC subunit C